MNNQGKVYTTGKVAKILGLSPRKAQLLMNNGHLQGYRLPSQNDCGDRRIYENSVLEFLAERGYEFQFRAFGDNKVDVVMPTHKFLTTRQVARTLGLSTGKVQRLSDQGNFKGYSLPALNSNGDHRRISEDSVLEFLAERGYDFQLHKFGKNQTDVVIPSHGFLTTGKAAKITGVCDKSIVNYLERGILNGYSLPETKAGNCHKVCKDSLVKCLAETGRLEFLKPQILTDYGLSLPTDAQGKAAA